MARRHRIFCNKRRYDSREAAEKGLADFGAHTGVDTSPFEVYPCRNGRKPHFHFGRPKCTGDTVRDDTPAQDVAISTPTFDLYTSMARRLDLDHGLAGDIAHDEAHLRRVWLNATRIMAVEGGDAEILVAATILHDCVAVPKNSPDRSKASTLSADLARRILSSDGWTADRIDAVAHAVEAHSFSAGIEPRTLEARILQDADRIDSLGAIGVARCFAVSGAIGRPLYDPDDAIAKTRPLDDTAWALDHFPAKLFGLLEAFKTEEGGRIAKSRHKRLVDFYDMLVSEISPDEPST